MYSKNVQIIIFCFFISYAVYCQRKNNDVIGSAGMHSVSSTGTMLSWTIGEPIVETQGGATYILTQGFHQPWISGSSTSLPIPQSPFFEINVYPNPVRDILSVSLSNNKERLYFDLYDISGRLIRHEQSSPDQTLVTFSIRWLSAGSYLLNIKTKDYGFNETYQLQKLR